jgi:hypothetical protein
MDPFPQIPSQGLSQRKRENENSPSLSKKKTRNKNVVKGPQHRRLFSSFHIPPIYMLEHHLVQASHDNAARAGSAVAVVIHVLLAHGHLHGATGRVAHLLVEAANLPYNIVKGLLDVPPRLG